MIYVYVRTHTAFVHEDMDICRQERGDRLGTYAAVCLVHSYVCFAYVRRNACNMHVYVSIYLYPYIHVSVYMRMYTCMYVCIFIYIYIYVYTHTDTAVFRHVEPAS